MKKINLLLLFVGILGMTFITSCTPDENTDVKPTISFSSNGAGITGDVTVAPGAPLAFIVSAGENPNTKKNLKEIRVQSWKDNTPNIDTTMTINAPTYANTFNFNARSEYSKTEKFTFTVTDKAGESVAKSFTVTTEDEPVNANPITTYTATLLGAQTNATLGSYLNLHDGMVYKQAAANTNSADVDLIYYYGATNQASFASPTDVTVNGGSGNLSMATGFTTNNETIFASSAVTSSEFDAMTDDANFPASISGSTLANTLGTSDVIEFITHDGKIGLIKVTGLNTGATGDITISVKIQQ